mgnify:FL=1
MSTNLRLSDGIFMDYLQTSLPYRSYSLFDNKHLKYNVMRKKNYTSPFCEVYPLNEEGALLGNTNNNNSTTSSNDSTQPPTLRVDNESGKEIENEDDIL